MNDVVPSERIEPSDQHEHSSGHAAGQSCRSQGPNRVVLIRPHRFSPNPLTETDNRFQSRLPIPADQAAQRAYDEVTDLADRLCGLGVDVRIFEDLTADTPDSVFPNNWFSTHDDGTVVVYPMHAPNRRAERRTDVIDHLKESGTVHRIIDYSQAESDGLYLEGTGAMVLDHIHRIAYVCRSQRASARLVRRFCEEAGYRPVVFDAVDAHDVPVYHTNVLMSVGTGIAVIGSPMIRDRHQRSMVLGALRGSGREVVELTERQIQEFAGNCLEVSGADGPVLIMSTTAASALTRDQIRRISEYARLEAVDVSTIEAAGGSVRCMIAGNHLPRRTPAAPAA